MTTPSPTIDAALESRIRGNFARFEGQLAVAERHAAKGDIEAAGVYAAMATLSATHRHAGIYCSPRLERMLNALGRAIPDRQPGWVNPRAGKPFERILHVATEIAAVGGLPNMLRRWIAADTGRRNSVAITQHHGPTDPALAAVVAASGGQVHRINHKLGASQIAWVHELRRLARNHDAVVLHVYGEDVIPLLAFANAAGFPPVLFLNHADHLFWLGASITHLNINLRDAASDLAIGRRGIPANRNILMPTIVEPTVRRQTREQARKALGVSDDTTLLVSAARAVKYRTLDGVTFADMHAPMLEKDPNAVLMVVGAGAPDDWGPANARVNNRIIPVQPTDPKPYYEAADIYVDSFPFVSSTSMMEAGGYGLPLVTLFTAPDDARIVGINHVGLVGTSLLATSLPEYQAIVARLLSDKTYRAEAGEAARRAVEAIHAPPGWLDWLDKVYARALELPPLQQSEIFLKPDLETPHFGDPDGRIEALFGMDYRDEDRLKGYLGMLSLPERLARWRDFSRAKAFDGPKDAVRHLLPEWLVRRIKDVRSA